MHILLVTYFYKPSILSGSRRLGMLVDALRSKGCVVHVLAGGGPFGGFSEKDVHRPQYRDWWWTLHAIAEKYKIISWYKKRIKRDRLIPTVRSVGWKSFSEVHFPDKYLSWIRPATILGVKLIRDHKIDIIYSSFPSPSSVVVARRLKKRSGLPWVCELRDLWTDSPHDVARGTFASFNNWYEKRILRDADAFVGVTKGISDTLKMKYGKPTEMIYSPVEMYDCRPSSNNDIFNIVYTGALYSGSRDISSLVRAIKILDDRGEITPKTFQFRYFGFDDRQSVEAMFAPFNAVPYLSFGGRVSREESVEEQKKASLLYVIPMGIDRSFDGIMTAKVFEYLGHRKPILATSVKGGELDNFLRETGCGLSLTEPEEIARSLSRWIRSYREGDPNLGEFEPKEDIIRQYSKEKAAEKLMDIFATLASLYHKNLDAQALRHSDT